MLKLMWVCKGEVKFITFEKNPMKQYAVCIFETKENCIIN